jgi:dual oxidase
LQNIILYEYLPAFLGEDVEKYEGYKSDLHPGISHVFQSAAFRYGHTLIPPGIYRRGHARGGGATDKCNFKEDFQKSPALRLCSTWWDAQGDVAGANDNAAGGGEAVEDILRGLASQGGAEPISPFPHVFSLAHVKDNYNVIQKIISYSQTKQ